MGSGPVGEGGDIGRQSSNLVRESEANYCLAQMELRERSERIDIECLAEAQEDAMGVGIGFAGIYAQGETREDGDELFELLLSNCRLCTRTTGERSNEREG